jgi:hypothetical protein
MKKSIIFLFMLMNSAIAQDSNVIQSAMEPTPEPEIKNEKENAVIYIAYPKKAGGVEPCLVTWFLGPRVGLEMNERKPIELIDIIRFAGQYACIMFPILTSYETGYKAAGMKGFLASCCIGHRVGSQLKERRVRTKEYLMLIPIVNI